MRAQATMRIGRATAGLLCLALLCSGPAAAGEIAVLRNGFTIRHEHHLVLGANTRLYLDGGTTSYVDVPTANIENFEKDLVLPTIPAPRAHQGAVASSPAADRK